MVRRIEGALSEQEIEAGLARERSQPPRWWYLSFSGGRFLGAAVVLAPGMIHAVQRCHRLGINPGGQVLGMAITEPPPVAARDRLLSEEDVKQFFGAVQRVDSNGHPVH